MVKNGINIREIFGKNVRCYRKKEGMSQEKLAEKLEISPNHLGLIERGKQFVSHSLLERIICELAVTPSALFYAENALGSNHSLTGMHEAVVKDELEKAYRRIAARFIE